MCLSERANLSKVADLLESSQGESLLDIGIGYGIYGAIAKMYMGIWLGRKKINLEGIELEDTFKSPVWGCYDEIYIGNALDILPKLDKYDVAISLHMIEHLERTDGLLLLEEIEKHAIKRIIIGTPSEFFETGWKEPGQQHRSLWNELDFQYRGYNTEILPCGDILAWKDVK